MEVAFGTKSIRLLCESELEAIDALGEFEGAQLQSRVADLMSAESMIDLVALSITGGPDNLLFLPLGESHRLVIKANHLKVPFGGGGTEVDWARVRRVQIVRIEPND